jgi:hypothetical protein
MLYVSIAAKKTCAMKELRCSVTAETYMSCIHLSIRRRTDGVAPMQFSVEPINSIADKVAVMSATIWQKKDWVRAQCDESEGSR